MSPIEHLEIFEDFEREHDVSQFVLQGVWVWPLIRSVIGGEIWNVRASRGTGVSSAVSSVSKASRLRSQLTTAHRALVATARGFARKLYGRPLPKSDVLFLGRGKRCQAVNGSYQDLILDPLADAVEKTGSRVAFFQWQSSPLPRQRPVRDLTAELADEHAKYLSTRRWETIPTPSNWFNAVEKLGQEHGYRLSWTYLWTAHRKILTLSRYFEGLLRQTAPEMVVSDCWYDWSVAAFFQAAARLKIPSLDVQHGIQEFGHWGYHGWQCERSTFPSSFPSGFWVWGERAATHYSRNRISAKVIIGGNLWLDRSRQLSKTLRPTEKDLRHAAIQILYTTTWPVCSHWDRMEQLIATSPPTWRWYMRLHPGEPEKSRALSLLSKFGDRVETVDANSHTLYELFHRVHLHFTHDSTCALEAMAFGIPSVITTQTGVDAFAEMLQRGHMIDGTGDQSALELVEAALHISPTELVEQAVTFFAENSQSATIRREDLVKRLTANQWSSPRKADSEPVDGVEA